MKIIVGLGNPGKKYEKTRHNVGFMIIDALAKKTCTKVNKNKFSSKYGEFHYFGEKIVLLKPQTYMNLSGKAVRECFSFFSSSLEREDILVVYDDIALDIGALRLRDKGSSGGHNGIQSVIEAMGTNRVARLRVGIKGDEVKGDLSDYVLSKFLKDEEVPIVQIVETARDACVAWIDNGIQQTMDVFNRVVQ